MQIILTEIQPLAVNWDTTSGSLLLAYSFMIREFPETLLFLLKYHVLGLHIPETIKQ